MKPSFAAGGVAFNDGAKGDNMAIREAKAWLNAIREDKAPVTLPEQAFCVTRILEGIYESAKSGKPYYFN